MKKHIGSGLLVLIIGLASSLAMAGPRDEWRLVNSESRLNFSSTKNDKVGEVHHFDTLSGRVAEDGKTTISIDLNSVQTWIDIRNERLREFLFETVRFPAAVITTTIDLKQFESLAIGRKISTSTEVTLSLHGVSKKIEAGVEVVRLGKDRVLVVPDEMIMLDAASFGLGSGVDKLKELAKLQAISTAIPVNFSFVFERGR